jgi:SnoaL-like domain
VTAPEGGRPEVASDGEALYQLSTAYAAAVDRRDGVGFAALFVASGELLVPDVPADLGPVISRTGHEALRRIPDGLRRYDRTFHQVSNHRFSIDGDRATGDVQCVAHHVLAAHGHGADPPGRGTDTVWFIRYRDDYVRTTDGWRFGRRALHLQWIEEHPVSSLRSDPVDG